MSNQVKTLKTTRSVNVEDVLLSFGSFNRFQLCVFVLAGMGEIVSVWHNLVPAFYNAPSNEVKCCLPSDVALTNDSIPWEEDKDGVWRWSQCEVYVNYSAKQSGGETIPCPLGYNYTDDFVQTVITQWDLVCGKAYQADTASSLLLVGAIVGILFWPVIGDNYGRRLVILASYTGACIIGSALVLVNTVYGLMVVRFFLGLILAGRGLCCFVLAMEWFTVKQRTFFGQAYWVFWVAGYCSLPLLAFYIRDWKHLQLVISVPFIVSFAMKLILPESAHWYMSRNKQDSAKAVLQRAAKVNGVILPDYTLKKNDSVTVEKAEAKKTFWDVIKHKQLRRYSFIACFVLFCNALVYYGLSLGATLWAGNMYLNFFYSGLIELPAYVVGYYALKWWGRPRPICVFHIIAGLPLILQIFIPRYTSSGGEIMWVQTMLNVTGKFGITASFASMFLLVNEIYPTIVRNAGFGLASMSARLGAVVAPFAANTLSLLAAEAVFITFGILAILAGLMCLLLPETLTTPLLETMDDTKLLADPVSELLDTIKDCVHCQFSQTTRHDYVSEESEHLRKTQMQSASTNAPT